ARAEKAIKEAKAKAIELLEQRKRDLDKWDKPTQDSFHAWFGTLKEHDKKKIRERIVNAISKLQKLRVENFVAEPRPTRKAGESARHYHDRLADYATDFAFVNPDKRRGKYEMTVHVGPLFNGQKVNGHFQATDATTRAGTLIHEVSHFFSVQDTEDVESCAILRKQMAPDKPKTMDDCRVYGPAAAKELAQRWPHMAMINADNFEFFVERRAP
ncbi:MAG TPA: M35 family metallo-endopeptidase, partial [Pirellulales bacterium]|nr:M35 family metallo-endopeptidase [Pirellulales bacterium]